VEKHIRAIIFIVLVLSLAGLYEAFQLPVELFPNIAYPRIMVIAEVGDMPADRMMITVTRKLEEALNSIPDVVSIRSTTSRGTSELSINFHWNIDMVKAELLVNNAINQVRGEMPSEFQAEVSRMNPTVFPVIGYSLISDKRDLVGLRSFAEYTIRPELINIDGVSRVDVLGGRTKEYDVIVNPERLRSFGLSLTDLSTAISNANIIKSVGKIEQDYRLYLTLVDGQYTSAEQIGRTVVKFDNANPVFLDEIATIKESTVPEWTRVTANGKEAVLLNVYQQPGGNTVRIDSDIRNVFETLKTRIPADIIISSFYDQSDLITESMKSVRDSILIGIILAIAVLFAFLRNWKITIIAALNVPLTIIITILLMRVFNLSFNIMTLGGIAAAIGLVIDDSIVVVENTVRHLSLGIQEAGDAVHASVKEMTSPIIGSSMSTIVVFAPLAFLTGVAGAFFKSLSLTMASSLVVSMLLSLLLVPVLSRRFITEADAKGQEKQGRLFSRIQDGYEHVLGFLLNKRSLAVIIAIVLMISSYLLYRSLPTGFLPEMDEGTFILDYRTQPGTSLVETDRVLKQIEAILTTVPEVESYSRRTGLQLGGALTEADMGDFLIRLKAKRNRSIEEITDDVREKVLAKVPGIEIEFAQLMGDLIGDLTAVPQPIEIKVFGDNYEQIHLIASKVADEIQKVKGVVDIYDGVTIAGAAITAKVNNLQASRFGLNANSIQEEVDAALNGTIASEVQGAQYMTGIRVWYPYRDRENIDKIKRLPILTSKGGYTPLGEVAEIKIEEGQPELKRESLKQMIAVTARISGRDLGGTLNDIKAVIKDNIKLPHNVFIQYGGLYKEQQESFKGLLAVLIMAILLVFSVLVVEFESFRIPLVVLLMSVLSLFGVFLLLRVTGVALNISSMMGMVMIVGIVAENSIFVIHYIRKFIMEGSSVVVAVIEAGKIRMRPIIMTTLAAVLALMPLAIGIGAGAQMQQPLAIAVIGGFCVSSLLLLFLLPVFFVLLLGQRNHHKEDWA
jgi:CzcA family heavy metal efflux pump